VLPLVLVASLGTGLALQIWALIGADAFFLSPAARGVLIWPAGLVAVVVGCAWLSAIRHMEAQPNHYAAQFKRFNVIARYFILPVTVGFLCTFLPLMNAVPAALNRAIGNPFSATFVVATTGKTQGRRDRCSRIDVEGLDDYWFGRLCVSDQTFSAIAPSETITLSGVKSWFGMEAFQIANAPESTR
jgi:hypothetical protein